MPVTLLSFADFGRICREQRDSLGLSQQGLGRLAGLSQATVSLLEQGRIETVSFAKVAVLCGALGIELPLHAEEAFARFRSERLAPLRDASEGGNLVWRVCVNPHCPKHSVYCVLERAIVQPEWIRVDRSSTFCPVCGSSLADRCRSPACRSGLVRGSAFCLTCGETVVDMAMADEALLFSEQKDWQEMGEVTMRTVFAASKEGSTDDGA